jgi:general nucleoside transport system permease protein
MIEHGNETLGFFGIMIAFLGPFLQAAIRSGTPLLFATIGEIYTERSGNINLGIEGLMLIGAVFGFMTSLYTGNPILGVILGSISGGLISMIHAFLTVTLNVNQIVSGLSLVFFGTGVSAVIGTPLIGEIAPSFDVVRLGFLSDIPLIGEVFFQHNVLVYFSYVFVPLSWFFLYKTRTGLYIRTVGENPQTADAVGLNVAKIRYAAIFVGGMMMGLAGAYLSLAYTPMWIENMVSGRGWVAIALVIFSKWNPMIAIFGAYLFGGMDALGFALQARGIQISTHLLGMLPYLFTIILLAGSMWRMRKKSMGQSVSMGPTALGKPFAKEQKS